jgi:hypothetical protein
MGRPPEWVKRFSWRAAMKSPGALSQRREILKLFWLEIAKGLASETAAVAVGAGPVLGSRWFRRSGGVPRSRTPRTSWAHVILEVMISERPAEAED